MPSLPPVSVTDAATVFPSGSSKRRKRDAIQTDVASSDGEEILPDFLASEFDEETQRVPLFSART